ncbi:hypothetical protein [Nonomuraea sp. bgisy101]|uniref:hypothetical protein n=1 Tax=Nonomuraea sp. bgisy101 TaxID=3413784 RepID=UPI003D755DBD
MGDYVGYHGIHVALGYPQCASIEWNPVTPRADRVRVQASTCGCSQVIYEYCSAGGLFFVRRHDRTGDRMSVMESDWLIRRLTESLWLRILNGEAR